MQTNARPMPKPLVHAGLILSQVALALTLAACGHVLAMGDAEVKPPALAEFGFGPRASSQRVYSAKLEPREPIRLRQLQTVSVRVMDAQGNPVDDAPLYRAAEKKLQKAAADSDLLEQARTNTERWLRTFLGAAGFEQVDITWTKSPA